MTKRTFELKPATREKVPLLIGLFGPSSSGKTYSALRMAAGIQRVNGGKIAVIDTESKRALHYADKFDFHHLPFGAPFSPLDYLAAIEHCVEQGATTVVIDSMSHEHEGPGGVLEMHDQEVNRLAGGENAPEWKRNAANFSAWGKPKGDRRRLINTMLQLPCSFILCFRAKEKIKPLSKAEKEAMKASGVEHPPAIKQLGWMPIGDPEFVYEMAMSAMLPPNAGGVPDWNRTEEGEKQMVKLPGQFRGLFSEPKPFSEEHGEAMARWAAGDSVGAFEKLSAAIDAASDPVALESLIPDLTDAKNRKLVTGDEYKRLRVAYGSRKDALAFDEPTREPGEDDE